MAHLGMSRFMPVDIQSRPGYHRPPFRWQSSTSPHSLRERVGQRERDVTRKQKTPKNIVYPRGSDLLLEAAILILPLLGIIAASPPPTAELVLVFFTHQFLLFTDPFPFALFFGSVLGLFVHLAVGCP